MSQHFKQSINFHGATVILAMASAEGPQIQFICFPKIIRLALISDSHPNYSTTRHYINSHWLPFRKTSTTTHALHYILEQRCFGHKCLKQNIKSQNRDEIRAFYSAIVFRMKTLQTPNGTECETLVSLHNPSVHS